jgi:hypothetical protein
MANDVSSRQWRLDTPVAFGSANAIIWPGNLYVKAMYWANAGAPPQNAIVKDRNGKIVWAPTTAAGETDIADIRLTDIGWVEGFVLDTLTAGQIIVYVK